MEHLTSSLSARLVRIDVSEPPRFGSRHKVRPRADRLTHLEWRYHFFVACDEHPRLDWRAAGYARCRLDELEDVEAAFREAAGEANRRFAEEFGQLDPSATNLLQDDDAIHDSYPILFP